MKSKFLGLVAAVLVMAAAPAYASDAQLGQITGVMGMSNGAVLFNTNGSRGPRPSCSGPGLDARYAINASTLAGQAQLSAFMTAFALKKRIFVRGAGACTIWADTETVDWFLIED